MYERMKTVSFKISEDLLKELDRMALELDTNRSVILRSLVEELVRTKNAKPRPHIGRGIKIW